MPRNPKMPCRLSSWHRFEIACGETGDSHRIVRQRRKRTRGYSESRREQADAVQLEESATRSRGSNIRETQEEA